MTKKNQYGHEIIKIEIETTKAWRDHVLKWANKHEKSFDNIEEILKFFTDWYIDQQDKKRKRVLDDFAEGFIKGYAMGTKTVPDDTPLKCAKWVIPHTLKAEALEQMVTMHRELS